ncbi:hypothetical protein OOZ54_12570 [Rhodopseudomonas palustris]|uniref:hypothetical protein n=1 Tax=Rhodopseudomonas palustris TaxID=1076 RepID=UPI0022F02C16|nr:hypothetical protein [Rhodopseudomonas palustris]WBU27528.1 hypothetical protein OOZ54_12570 [Rhodopseudomonas palustris]
MNDIIKRDTGGVLDSLANNSLADPSQSSSLIVGDASLSSRLMLQYDIAARRPRSPTRVRTNLLQLVTLDPASAVESMYALPRGGKPVTGPSIRFAEALKQAWGNCWASSEVRRINREEKFVESVGLFIDFETNSVTESTHQRSIADRNGKVFKDDLIRVTANAASSIAMREAILKGVPKPVWREAYDAVVRIIAGDIKTLAQSRESALQAFAIFGVKPEQVFGALGVPGADDILLDHIPVMRGMFAALKSGEATVEEMFGRPEKQTADPTYNPLVRTGGGAPKAQAADAATSAESAPGSVADGAGSVANQTAENDAAARSMPAGAQSAAGGETGEPSTTGRTTGAEGVGDASPSAPDRLRDYSGALLRVDTPPKLGRQSDAWIQKNGSFSGEDEAKRKKIYAEHLRRATGEADLQACKAAVEGIIG